MTRYDMELATIRAFCALAIGSGMGAVEEILAGGKWPGQQGKRRAKAAPAITINAPLFNLANDKEEPNNE